MKKYIFVLLMILVFNEILKAQNVGINNTGAAPAASAMLDIVAPDKGLLVPRFALSDITVAAPVTSPAVSLIIYNTATAGVMPNNVLPGFYYWDGTKWVAFSGTGGKNWALLGNAGTVAGTNFLGTTDNVDLVFKVNNIQAGKLNIANNQTFLGYQAGLNSGTTAGNSFYGYNSGTANSSGTYNTALGHLTFTTSTSGNFNTTAGYGSMRNNLSGSNNTFYGVNAGANWSTTSNNTGVGMFALQGLSGGTGAGNTAIGYAAGSGTTPNNLATGNGSFNTFVGYNSALNNSAFTNATAIGANALAGASDVIVLGGVNGTNGATTDARVGIGITIPASSAMLDITSTNKGFLAPRVALTAINAAGPVTGPATGLLVYNTATAGASPNNVVPGYYYWDGAAWVRFAAGNNTAWTIVGNAATVAGTNFIGTTDAIDWVVKTNNTERMRVLSAGNVGIGTAAPNHRLDVLGSGGSTVDFRTSGRMWTNSASGGIWLSDLQDCFVGNISTTQLGFWTSTVGWNALNITKTSGYVGVGTSAPSSRLHVVDNAQNLPVIYGVNTNGTAATTSFGVRGECGSTGLGSAGVSGVSINSSQNEIGVVGDYSLWGAAVFGLAWASAYTDMPATRDFGIFGTCNFSTGTGIYARDMSNAAGSYAFYGTGKFAVTGAKAASVPTTKGNQLLYCQESPEMWFEDIGSSKLINGRVEIKLDELYLETVFIDNTHPMQVFLQENGESNGLIVIKEKDKFIVKEKNGGTSNIEFSYRVLAKRRFYQDHRFGVDSNQPFEDNLRNAKDVEPLTTDPMVMKAFVEAAKQQKEAEYASKKAEEAAKNKK